MEQSWSQLKSALNTKNSPDGNIVCNALTSIKDLIIGSNNQKSLLIMHELLPDIIEICSSEDIPLKAEALTIIGSLAKGPPKLVNILVEEYKIIPILCKELSRTINNNLCIEISLGALCSISQHVRLTSEEFFNDNLNITSFLDLTITMCDSLKSQIYITTILCSLCVSSQDQLNLLNAGAIMILARMMSIDNEQVQIPALSCLSCMCYGNRSVSDIICVTSYHGQTLTNTLNEFMSRALLPDIQLTAARCVTYIYRSGTLPPTDSRVLNRTLPCLVRLCSDDYKQNIRASAAETLALLIEIDAKLQRTAAICNHLLKSLFQLMKINEPNIKQASLKCLASLGANDETIRKKIINLNSLMDSILQSINDWDTEVRIATIRCLHSLSRSVQQLRTTFQDHSIWEPLMYIINNESSEEFLIAVTATITNLLLEFSPSKTPLLNAGILEKLCELLDHENCEIRLNSIWALMNLTYQADDTTKNSVINNVGMNRFINFLDEDNSMIVLKTLGVLRNLLNQPLQIDLIMSETNSPKILNSFCVILDSSLSSAIKEQVLCIIGSIAAENTQIDYMICNDHLLKLIGELLFHTDKKLQSSALYVINNIVQRKDVWSDKCFLSLRNMNVLHSVQELNTNMQNVQINRNDYISRVIKQIVVKCKNMYPDMNN